jgi:hypothetical protein
MNKNTFKIFNEKIKKIKKKRKKNYLGYTSSTITDLNFKLYKSRLKNIRLTWCRQVFEIIKNFKFSNPRINDLGCNYFQFYKEIKFNNYNCNYFGYDIDDKFIKLGLTKFPELKNKYKIANVEKVSLRKTDISIISDTLELTENPQKIINNIILSTKKIIIMRTFLSDKEEVKLIKNEEFIKQPYFNNVFSYTMIIDYLIKNDFYPQIYPDFATNLSQINEIFPCVKRRFFIILFTKKNLIIKNFKTKVQKKLFKNKLN